MCFQEKKARYTVSHLTPHVKFAALMIGRQLREVKAYNRRGERPLWESRLSLPLEKGWFGLVEKRGSVWRGVPLTSRHEKMVMGPRAVQLRQAS